MNIVILQCQNCKANNELDYNRLMLGMFIITTCFNCKKMMTVNTFVEVEANIPLVNQEEGNEDKNDNISTICK